MWDNGDNFTDPFDKLKLLDFEKNLTYSIFVKFLFSLMAERKRIQLLVACERQEVSKKNSPGE